LTGTAREKAKDKTAPFFAVRESVFSVMKKAGFIKEKVESAVKNKENSP
jgi:hypothetical protein